MKKILAAVLALFMVVSLFLLTSCNNSNTGKKTLKVAMECAYAPYNWAQSDNSNGSVPISGRSDFANGYDVMIAKKICEKNGWDLEIYSLDWDALIPAVQTGQVDCVIAGQSMTEDRKQQVDFAGPYLYATIVCLVKSDSAYASATSINDFAGAKCTSQLGTIWYDTCLPQVKDATVLAGKESAPAMLMALETGEVDFVCTDRPTAQAAVIAYPDLKILDFAGTEGDFQVDEGEINIGISVKKGNTALVDAINSCLKDKTADDFNAIMNDAIKIQPVSN